MIPAGLEDPYNGAMGGSEVEGWVGLPLIISLGLEDPGDGDGMMGGREVEGSLPDSGTIVSGSVAQGGGQPSGPQAGSLWSGKVLIPLPPRSFSNERNNRPLNWSAIYLKRESVKK